jgi:hypothetical protein
MRTSPNVGHLMDDESQSKSFILELELMLRSSLRVCLESASLASKGNHDEVTTILPTLKMDQFD